MSNMPSVRLITLGCAKNEVDSEEIAGVLQRAGYRLDAHTDAPDVVVINTCGFLESAQREGMATIRDALRLKRQGKTQRVIVAGCMVQRLGESLQQQFPEVDAWVGVGQMARFAEIVDAARATRQPIADIQPPHHRWADVPTRLRSRAPWTAYLKVSEGCDHQCTFCTIPSFRGRHVSKPLERILEEARWLAHNGAKNSTSSRRTPPSTATTSTSSYAADSAARAERGRGRRVDPHPLCLPVANHGRAD
jgi:2-methylthioadenine synthetase